MNLMMQHEAITLIGHVILLFGICMILCYFNRLFKYVVIGGLFGLALSIMMDYII